MTKSAKPLTKILHLIRSMPRYQDLEWEGMDFPEEKFEELQTFDRAAWRAEVLGHEELFLDLHAHLPKELMFERELLICRM